MNTSESTVECPLPIYKEKKAKHIEPLFQGGESKVQQQWRGLEGAFVEGGREE